LVKSYILWYSTDMKASRCGSTDEHIAEPVAGFSGMRTARGLSERSRVWWALSFHSSYIEAVVWFTSQTMAQPHYLPSSFWFPACKYSMLEVSI